MLPGRARTGLGGAQAVDDGALAVEEDARKNAMRFATGQWAHAHHWHSLYLLLAFYAPYGINLYRLDAQTCKLIQPLPSSPSCFGRAVRSTGGICARGGRRQQTYSTPI
eukprot:6195998-Pleurochrysis_carterae.AAC.2